MSRAHIKQNMIVKLASDGPKMTVTKIDDDLATCIWFAGDSVKTHQFPIGCLKKHDEVTHIKITFAEPKAKPEEELVDA